jgi:hypothetical protein
MGERVGISVSLLRLGEVALREGQHGEAGEHYRGSLTRSREMDDPQAQAESLVGLSMVATVHHDGSRAIRLLEEALSLVNSIPPWFELVVLVQLGHATLASGDIRRSRRCFHDSLELAQRTGFRPLALSALTGMARLCSLGNDGTQAAELLGLVLHHPASMQITRDTANQLLADLEEARHPEAIEAAVAHGRERGLEEVVAEVLERDAGFLP